MAIRKQVIYSVEKTQDNPGFRTDVVRQGEPNEDMTSVEVSYRAVSFTITPSGKDHIVGSREIQMSPQVALELANELADAANKLIDEESN